MYMGKKYRQYIVPDELSKAMNTRGRDYVRELVRQRDGRTCQMCRKVWVVGQRRFDVHHLNGFCGKNSMGHDKVADIPNLITYCHKCHLNLDEVIRKMRTRSGNVKNSKDAGRHPFYSRQKG